MKRTLIIIGLVFFIFINAKSQLLPESIKIKPNKTLDQFMNYFNPKYIDSIRIVNRTLFFFIPTNDSMEINFYIRIDESEEYEKIIYKMNNKYTYLINSNEYLNIKDNKIIDIELFHSLSVEFTSKKIDENFRRKIANDSTFKGDIRKYYKKSN